MRFNRSILAIPWVVGCMALPLQASTTFKATLDGASNVPPIPSVTATGSASLVLNDDQTELSFHIEYDYLSSPESDAHIHNAGPRANGPIVFQLPIGEVKDGVWEIPPAMVAELLAGRLYINIHSDIYISGEIRGQIVQAVTVRTETLGAVKARYGPRR